MAALDLQKLHNRARHLLERVAKKAPNGDSADTDIVRTLSELASTRDLESAELRQRLTQALRVAGRWSEFQVLLSDKRVEKAWRLEFLHGLTPDLLPRAPEEFLHRLAHLGDYDIARLALDLLESVDTPLAFFVFWHLATRPQSNETNSLTKLYTERHKRAQERSKAYRDLWRVAYVDPTPPIDMTGMGPVLATMGPEAQSKVFTRLQHAADELYGEVAKHLVDVVASRAADKAAEATSESRSDDAAPASTSEDDVPCVGVSYVPGGASTEVPKKLATHQSKSAESKKRSSAASKRTGVSTLAAALNIALTDLLVASGRRIPEALHSEVTQYLGRQRRNAEMLVPFADHEFAAEYLRGQLTFSLDNDKDRIYRLLDFLAKQFHEIVPELSDTLVQVRTKDSRFEPAVRILEAKFGNDRENALLRLWVLVAGASPDDLPALLDKLRNENLLSDVYMKAMHGFDFPRRRRVIRTLRDHVCLAAAVDLIQLEMRGLPDLPPASQLDTIAGLHALLSEVPVAEHAATVRTNSLPAGRGRWQARDSSRPLTESTADIDEGQVVEVTPASSAMATLESAAIVRISQLVRNAGSLRGSQQQLLKLLEIPALADGLLPMAGELLESFHLDDQRGEMLSLLLADPRMDDATTVGRLLQAAPTSAGAIARLWIARLPKLPEKFLSTWWRNESILSHWRPFWTECISAFAASVHDLLQAEPRAKAAEEAELQRLIPKIVPSDDAVRPSWLTDFFDSVREDLQSFAPRISKAPEGAVQKEEQVHSWSPRVTREFGRWLHARAAKLLGTTTEAPLETVIEALVTEPPTASQLDAVIDFAITLASLDGDDSAATLLQTLVTNVRGLRAELCILAAEDSSWVTPMLRRIIDESGPQGSEFESTTPSAPILSELVELKSEDFYERLRVFCAEGRQGELGAPAVLAQIETANRVAQALERAICAYRRVTLTLARSQQRADDARVRALRRLAPALGRRLQSMEIAVAEYLKFREHLESLDLLTIENGLGATAEYSAVPYGREVLEGQGTIKHLRRGYLVRTLGLQLPGDEMVIPAFIEPTSS